MNKEKLIVLSLAALNFTHIMDFMIMMPMGEMLMAEYHLRPDQFTLLVSSYTICAAISGFFSSFLIDRYPRKSSLMFIYSGFIIGTFASGLADSYFMLLLVRGLTGAFGGIMGAQAMAIITDLVPYERRGKAIGTLTGAFSAASVVGVPFGLYLADTFHWNIPFFIIAIIGLPLLGIIYKFMPELDAHLKDGKATVNPVRTLTAIFSVRNQRIALMQSFLVTLAHFMIIPFITPYLIRNVGFAQSDIIYIYIIGGLFTVFVAPFVGSLIDKYKAVPVYVVLVILAIIPVLLLTHLPPVPVWVGLSVTTLFFILGGSRMVPSATLVSGTIPAKIRGSFMSFNSCIQQLGTASASLLAGAIVTSTGNGPLAHYNTTGYVAIGISLLTLLILPRLKVIQEQVAKPLVVDDKIVSDQAVSG